MYNDVYSKPINYEVRDERRGLIKLHKMTISILGIEIYSKEIKETI